MTIQIGGLAKNSSLNTNSNPYSSSATSRTSGMGLTVPSATNNQTTIRNPMTGNGQPSNISIGTNTGVLPTPPKPDTTYTHTTTTTSPTGAKTVAKPTSNSSVLAQQQSLNQTNKNTPGYIPLVEDGLAGPKTSAAIAQYGFNTQTGQPNTPKSGTTSGVIPKTETKVEKPPADLNIAGQTPGVLGSGQQTQSEIDTQNRMKELSNNPSQAYIDSQNKVKEIADRLAAYDTETNNMVRDIGGQGISLDSSRGQQTNIATARAGNRAAIASELATMQGQVNAANTQQATQTTAGQGAYSGAQTQAARATTAGTSVMSAVAPQFPGYGQQVIQPGLLGTTGGQTGQLPQDATDFINSLAQQVKSGMMTRGEAEGKISQYSQPGLQAFNDALGSGFNTNASNASSSTTAIGQQLEASIPPANQALDLLKTAFNNLGSLTGSSIPLIQEIAQNVSMKTGAGRTNVSAFQGALQEARSRIDAALTGVIGVDAAGRQANALLPDNMTAKELPIKIAAAKEYLKNQLTSYKGSGAQNQTSGSTTGGSIWNF